MKNYLTNCEYIKERIADYDTRDTLRKMFVAAKDAELSDCNGNLAAHITFNKKTKVAKFNKDWASSDDKYAAMYEAIPSALALYRLCAFDAVEVQAHGPEGYKCVWSTALIHAQSGRIVFFGEHKGAFSFWTRVPEVEIKDKAFIKDLLSLLTYLVSDTCAHPYDGLVAGSVA